LLVVAPAQQQFALRRFSVPLTLQASHSLKRRVRSTVRPVFIGGLCHGGAVGHSGLQVLHALIFDFMNYTSGRLDPSYAIAKAANVCERTVNNAITRLKELGILNWVRRCAESMRDGRFVLEQETNAYPSPMDLSYHYLAGSTTGQDRCDTTMRSSICGTKHKKRRRPAPSPEQAPFP